MTLRLALPLGDLPRLVSFQHQQLSVCGEELGDGFFEVPAHVHALADDLDPVFGDTFHVLLALHHEGEQPEWMSLALGTMTGRLAATPIRLGQGTGDSVGRDLEPGEELAFSPSQACGLGVVFGCERHTI